MEMEYWRVALSTGLGWIGKLPVTDDGDDKKHKGGEAEWKG
jgi:hypothetical protein